MNPRIGFFLQGSIPEYIPVAKRMVESAKKAMPGTEIHQLTDGVTEPIEGANWARRVRNPMPMGVRRLRHYAGCEGGDWILIDCDVIFNRSVLEVFGDKDFEIAITDRIGTDMEGTPYAKAMPYNFGVIFSRCPSFWRDAEMLVRMMSPALQEWGGEQRALAAMVADGRYKVKILPGLVYNYPPLHIDDLLITDAAIIHLKGARKRTLLENTA